MKKFKTTEEVISHIEKASKGFANLKKRHKGFLSTILKVEEIPLNIIYELYDKIKQMQPSTTAEIFDTKDREHVDLWWNWVYDDVAVVFTSVRLEKVKNIEYKELR